MRRLRRRSMPKKRSLIALTGSEVRCEVRDGARRGFPTCATSCAPPSTRACSRRSVPRPVVGEELAFEAGDIDADGALGFAGSAFEAEIENVVDAFVAESRFAESAGHRETQNICAASRACALLRASPCRTGTSCLRASCGRRRVRCTSRLRRPCRRSRSSRRKFVGWVFCSRRRSGDWWSAAESRRSCRD